MLGSFTNTIDKLLVQILILLENGLKVPMPWYSIWMLLVPIDVDKHLGNNKEYT